MSNDYLYFVAQEFAKPLNDAQMCGVITPSCIYLWCKFPPLGRVFKIHDFFLHGFEKKDIVNS